MKSVFFLGFGVVALAIAFIISWNFIFPAKEILVGGALMGTTTAPQKTLAERIAEAREKSNSAKGLYMTADVANDQGVGGTRIRNNLIRLADTTEINTMVIDVKEACGPDLRDETIRNLVAELHQKNIWTIARIVVLSDSSRIEVNPEWYITRKTKVATGVTCASKKHLRVKGEKPAQVTFWQDKAGRYWLDPAHPEVQDHIVQFSKRIIDLGFDEIQFDYIRFPSDGITPTDLANAIYPAWNGKTSKCAVMRDFFRYLNKNLKEHKPDIVLSADLFGYAAVGLDTDIGQCIDMLEDNFDYISFMVYPSHYYSGFQVPPLRELPAVKLTRTEARTYPDIVVGRSMIFARDFFDGKIDLLGKPFRTATSSATTTPQMPLVPTIRSHTRLRPWIEDFFHEQDQAAKRPYGVAKVRMQIDAAEKVEPGWILWNAGNVYSEAALKKE